MKEKIGHAIFCKTHLTIDNLQVVKSQCQVPIISITNCFQYDNDNLNSNLYDVL